MADDKVIDFTRRSLDVLVEKSLRKRAKAREIPRLWGCECGGVTFVLHIEGAVQCVKCNRTVELLKVIEVNPDSPPTAA